MTTTFVRGCAFLSRGLTIRKHNWVPRVTSAAWILSGCLFGAPVQAVTTTARSAGSFVDSIGVATHIGWFDTVYSNFSTIKQKMLDLGLKHFRDEMKTDSLVNARYAELGAAGIKATLLVNFNSYSAAQAVQLAKNLAGTIEMIEGPNELDLVQPSNWVEPYRSSQQQLFQAIKGDPQTAYLPVAMASIGAPFANAAAPGYLGNFMDYQNLHSYHGGQNPGVANVEPTLSNYITVNQQISGTNKPIVATETGYFSSTATNSWQRGVSEVVQGKYIPRTYLEYFRRGITRTYSYELVDSFPDPNNTDSEKHYGLLRNNLTDKPAYTATKNLIALLVDSGANSNPGTLDYDVVTSSPGVRHLLLQKSTGEFYLVLWNEVLSNDGDTSAQVALNLNTPIGQATAYLPNNSAGAVNTWTSPTQIALTVPDHPLVMRLTASAASVVAGRPDLVVAQVGYIASTLAVGAPVQFTATVQNRGTVATPDGTIVGVGFYFNGQGAQYYYNDQYTAALAPGQSVTLTAQQSWTPTAPGNVTVEARVDDVNRIAESSETNNTLSQTLVISTTPTTTGTGLKAEYFNDPYLTTLALTRTDQTVDFNWGTGAPGSAVPADNFSIRWSGQVQPLYSQTYTFYTDSDDGVRLRVNGQLLIDNWTDHAPTQNSATIALVAGQKYDLQMEYYERGGGATARLSWSSPSQPRQVIPRSQLFAAP